MSAAQSAMLGIDVLLDGGDHRRTGGTGLFAPHAAHRRIEGAREAAARSALERARAAGEPDIVGQRPHGGVAVARRKARPSNTARIRSA